MKSETQGVPKNQCCHQQDEGHTKVINVKMPRQTGQRQCVSGTTVAATGFSRPVLGISLSKLALNRLGKTARGLLMPPSKETRKGIRFKNQRDDSSH